jgi:hypothetical protein
MKISLGTHRFQRAGIRHPRHPINIWDDESPHAGSDAYPGAGVDDLLYDKSKRSREPAFGM